MAVDVQELSKVLEASLDPNQNKQGASTDFTSFATADLLPAEIALFQEEKKPNFSLSLLQIVATGASRDTARLAGALYFKNYIRRRWVVCRHLQALSLSLNDAE